MREAAQVMSDIADALRASSRVVVCAHVNPDGDAVGSTLGIVHALRTLRIDAAPVLADASPAPERYSFLPGFTDYVAASDVDSGDTFLALDAPTFARLGVAEDLARSARFLVVVDHHPDNERFGNVNWVDDTAGATGQMLWRLLPALGVEPDRAVANCLYAALLTDTGRFSFSNTDSDVLSDASDMVAAGADPHRAYAEVYESHSLEALRLHGVALSRITLANGGRVAYTWLGDADFVSAPNEKAYAENLIDVVRPVGGVDVVALARCVNGECRMSLRSKTGFDVGAVARRFGGGGHAAAAGYTSGSSLEDTLSALLALLPGSDDA